MVADGVDQTHEQGMDMASLLDQIAALESSNDRGEEFTGSGDDSIGRPKNELSCHLVDHDWEAVAVLLGDDERNDAKIPETHGRELGMIPLHYACREGAPPNIIKILLEKYPQGVMARTEETGRIPLHFVSGGREVSLDKDDSMSFENAAEACNKNNVSSDNTLNRVEAAKLLLAASPDSIRITDQDGGLYPLHIACLEEASPELLDVFLDADPGIASLPDEEGNIPLHWVFHPQVSVSSVQRLLQLFPDGPTMTNNEGMLPLHRACAVGAKADAIHLLLSRYPYGAHIKDKVNGNLPIHLILPITARGGICQQDRDLDLVNRTEILNELITIFPDGTGIKNNSGETVVHRACSGEAPLEFVRKLLDAFPSIVKTKGKSSEMTLLHLACTYHSPTSVVRALLDANSQQAECMASEGVGGAHLPLHAACRTGASIDVIKALLESYPAGAATTDGHDNRLPLHLECLTRCETEVVRLLLDADKSGAEKIDVKGRTALHYAFASHADQKVLDILIEAFPGAMEIHDGGGCLPDLALVPVQEEDEEDENGSEKSENEVNGL